MNPFKAILVFYFGALVILALIPWYHESILSATANLESNLRFIIRFLFDPLEYIWKWILFVLGGIILLTRRQ